jgi:hypothetical protein
MRARWAAALAALTVAPGLALAASPASAATGHHSAQQALDARLLTTHDLPTGWTRTSVSLTTKTTATPFTAGCLAIPQLPPSYREANAGFEKKGVGLFVESLVSGPGETAQATRAIRQYDRCTAVTFKAGGATTTAGITAQSFPPVSARVAAFHAQWTVTGSKHLREQMVFALFHSGDSIGVAAYLGGKGFDTSQATSLIIKAVDRAGS